MERGRAKKGYPAVSINPSTPHTAQECFTSRKTISIPTYELCPITVMAVAEDLHLDFLIPEYETYPTTDVVRPKSCVYSFV